jgi:hypothetical protein
MSLSIKDRLHNDTQHNELYRHTQHNGILPNDTRHKRHDDDIENNSELNDN